MKTPSPSPCARRQMLFTGSLLLAAIGALCAAEFVHAAEAPARAHADKQVQRGQYLVKTSGCHDCHTPWKLGAEGPEPDMSRMLSGHPQDLQVAPVPALPAGPWGMLASVTNTAYVGDWGVSFTANLTPDAETGLGQWTEKDFLLTIRTGRHMGRGRAILPPMPIPVYNNFSDADLRAIFAYLRKVPAVPNRVPEPMPPTTPVAAK